MDGPDDLPNSKNYTREKVSGAKNVSARVEPETLHQEKLAAANHRTKRHLKKHPQYPALRNLTLELLEGLALNLLPIFRPPSEAFRPLRVTEIRQYTACSAISLADAGPSVQSAGITFVADYHRKIALRTSLVRSHRLNPWRPKSSPRLTMTSSCEGTTITYWPRFPAVAYASAGTSVRSSGTSHH